MMLKFSCPLALGAILALSCAMAFAQVPDPQFSAAVQQLQQRNFAQAVGLAQNALAKTPKDCRWLTLRGMALNGSGRQQEALASFQHAAEYCPKYLPALEGMAQIQYAQRSPQAIATLEHILALRPGDETTHAMLAALYWQKNDCEHALEHFAEGGQIVENDPTAQSEYGLCLLETGKAQQAEELFQRAVQRGDSSLARMRFAYAAWKNKDNARALDALSPLVRTGPPNAMALRLAAQIAEDKGDTADAVKWLREAILAEPKNPDAYLTFSNIAFAHSSYQVGIDMLNAGITQLPSDARLYLARGVLLVPLGEYEKAIADFERAHKLAPELSLAEDAIGMMSSEKHNTAAALEMFRSQSQQHPHDALLQYLYAEALSQGNEGAQQTTEAIAALKRAVAIEPDYRPAHDLLSVLYLRANDLPSAVRHAEIALKLDPNDDTAVYQEILAYRRMGAKERVEPLVARLKQIKAEQQSRRVKALLVEAPSP
jgi:tetratricopeptide (TPR) repeat protein